MYIGKTPDGKQKYKTKTVRREPGWTDAKLKKEAQRQAVLFEAEVKAEADKANHLTLKTHIDELLSARKKLHKLTNKTDDSYRYLCDRIFPYFDGYSLEDITSRHIRAFAAQLASEGANRVTGGALALKTIREHLAFLHMVFEVAVEDGLIEKNPVKTKDYPQDDPDVAHEKKDKKLISQKDLQTLLTYIRDYGSAMWYALVMVMAASGGRRGEVCGLTWDCVDFAENTILINKQVIRTNAEGFHVQHYTKGKRDNLVTLPDIVFESLQRWKDEQDKFAAEHPLNYVQQGFVFTQKDGRPISPDSVNTYLDRLCKKLGITHITPHMFRHSLGSYMMANKASARDVADQLGHSDVRTTETYIHSVPDAGKRLLPFIEEYLPLDAEDQAPSEEPEAEQTP